MAWLAPPQSAGVIGQVIESSGLVLAVAEGCRRGPTTENAMAQPEDVDVIVRKLPAEATPRTTSAEVS